LSEAIYMGATSRSFRTAKMLEAVRHGADVSVVQALFRDGPAGLLQREQRVVIGKGRRSVQIDQKRPPTLAAFAVRSPVVCFHAAELELSTGPAAGRRTVLDRVALFVDASSAEHRARYQEALRARQRALELNGVDSGEIGPYEQICAEHGARMTEARARAAGVLIPALVAAFRSIATPGLTLDVSYVAGGSDDPAEMREELARRRVADRARGSASYGPHRDDLSLDLDGHPARAVASQGQHRAITMSLKLAELRAIAAASGKFPLLLLDDISSELDRDRMIALLGAVTEPGGQVIITTTRPELIETPGVAAADRRDVLMDHGELQ
jgi:DNA replication and repair protein RecF